MLLRPTTGYAIFKIQRGKPQAATLVIILSYCTIAVTICGSGGYFRLPLKISCCLVCCHHGKIQTGKPKPGGYPLLRRDKKHPPDERKEGDTMVTYSDLIQFSIFIVALVGLCYEIFKGKRK